MNKAMPMSFIKIVTININYKRSNQQNTTKMKASLFYLFLIIGAFVCAEGESKLLLFFMLDKRMCIKLICLKEFMVFKEIKA